MLRYNLFWDININLISIVIAWAQYLPVKNNSGCLYIKNLNNKEKKVFREINSSLNENAISEKEESEDVKIESKLISKIDKLSLLKDVRKRMLKGATAQDIKEYLAGLGYNEGGAQGVLHEVYKDLKDYFD